MSNIEELQLKVDQVYSIRFMDPMLFNSSNLHVTTWVDAEMGRAIRCIYKLLVHEEMLVEYPDGWWEAFKFEHFPAWLLARFPVRKRQVWARHKFPGMVVPHRTELKVKILLQEGA